MFVQECTPLDADITATAAARGAKCDGVPSSLAKRPPTQEDIPLDPDDIAVEEELHSGLSRCSPASLSQAAAGTGSRLGDFSRSIQSKGPDSTPVPVCGSSSRVPHQVQTMGEKSDERFSQSSTDNPNAKSSAVAASWFDDVVILDDSEPVDLILDPIPGNATSFPVTPSAASSRLPQEPPRGDTVGGANPDPPDVEDFESDSQFEALMEEFTSTDDFCDQLVECSYEEVEPDTGDPDWSLDEGS